MDSTQAIAKARKLLEYFEKNFAKLKAFLYRDYMVSRIWVAASGTIMTLYLLLETFFPASRDEKYIEFLLITAIIFLFNQLRKSMIRAVQQREEEGVMEKVRPRKIAREPWWIRIGYRLPFFQRRGLTGFIALSTEAFFIFLMSAALAAKGARADLYGLPPLWMRAELPDNSWMALAITEVALLLSWMNNSLFLLKIPEVRQKVSEVFKNAPSGNNLALYFPMHLLAKFFEDHREKRPCDQGAATAIAQEIMKGYRGRNMFSERQAELLERYLADVICRETDPHALYDEFVRHVHKLHESADANP